MISQIVQGRKSTIGSEQESGQSQNSDSKIQNVTSICLNILKQKMNRLPKLYVRITLLQEKLFTDATEKPELKNNLQIHGNTRWLLVPWVVATMK